MSSKAYSFNKAIKGAIQETRYRTSRLVNKELLTLYYAIGKNISQNSRNAKWGSNAIAAISRSLQEELPGLRVFSEGNMRKMRIFYEEWSLYFENRASATHEMITAPIEHVEIRALATNEVDKNALDSFLSIGFTHHYEIIKHAKSIESVNRIEIVVLTRI